MFRSFAVFFVFCAVAGCAVHQNAPPRPAQVTGVSVDGYARADDVRYTPDGWPLAMHADVYVPVGEGPFPGVLLVHGGGWARGNRTQMDGIARRLARSGFVVMNASYRFAPAYQYPAQLEDMHQALQWFSTHHARWSLDPDRIGGFGYSAGAHLVAMLALTGSAAESATRLGAVVAGGTPTDLSKYGGGELVPQFLGGTRDEVPERFADASPVMHVTAAAPPFFLYHGTMDLLVPIDHAEDLMRRLEGAGAHAELYRMRLRGHITAFLTDGGAVSRAIDFLHRELQVRDTSVPNLKFTCCARAD